MVYLVLTIFGLCFGSFINALVWRLHKQLADNKKSKKLKTEFSITKGRSMCVNCRHVLSPFDLVPLFSWLVLRGKCRYCHKPISAQYPLIEAFTAAIYILSYIYWPSVLTGMQWVVFALWLMVLIGLIALLVYDIRWMLLPNRLIFPTAGIALIQALVTLTLGGMWSHTIVDYMLAVLIGGGLFYILFQLSNGRWIGGGDVKLGFLLGLLAGTAEKSLLLIFLAAVLGTLVSIPLLASRQLKRTSVIPFGPFLIFAGIITVLFGVHIVHWYNYSVVRVG